MHILLVEDDEILGEALHIGLTQQGMTVDWVRDGNAALHACLHFSFDVIILDLGLPKKSGEQVIKELRGQKNQIPILVLTAKDSLSSRVFALDSGADDYPMKPCDLDELCARIRALVRRAQGRGHSEIYYNDLCLDPSAHRVTRQQQEVPLSRREFAILHILLSNQNKVLSRDRIIEHLYGWGEGIDSNAIEVHIHALRKKLGNDLIRTIRGVGYMVESRS